MGQPCIDVAVQQWSTLPELSHDTIVTFPLSRVACKVFAIRLAEFTVIDFSFNLQTSGVFTTVVTFYRKTGSTYQELASLQSTDLSMSFSKEFPQGDYIICFETPSFTSAQLTGVAMYRGYQRQVWFSIDFGHGQSFHPALAFIRPDAVCTRPLFFRIIDGSVPPGMWMTSLGRVQGTTPELDCMEDNASLSPSQNWSYTNFDGHEQAWGRQWRFQVEVSIQGMPDVVAYEWFCVSVHNNWDKDRDNFLSQAPFLLTREIVGQPEPIKIPDLCSVESTEQAFVPQEIPDLCPSEELPVAPAASLIAQPCGNCTSLPVAERRYPIPFGLPDATARDFKSWLALVESLRGTCHGIDEFAARLLADPLIQQYEEAKPVGIGTVNRELVVTLPTDDPRILFWSWRSAENQKLPWGADFQYGVSLLAALDTRPRHGVV